MLWAMNRGHNKLHLWGIEQLPNIEPMEIIDLGCGGGIGVKHLLRRFPQARITGLDYSPAALKQAARLNKKAQDQGRCLWLLEDVLNLTSKDQYHLACAFETVYFWSELKRSFKNVYTLLKNDGYFLIVNEFDGSDKTKAQQWQQRIEGMKIYSETELIDKLTAAGFDNIQVFKAKKSFQIAILAQK